MCNTANVVIFQDLLLSQRRAGSCSCSLVRAAYDIQYDIKVVADRILFQGPSRQAGRQAGSRAPDPHTRAGERHKVDAGGLPDCIKKRRHIFNTRRGRIGMREGGLQKASQLCINQGMARGPLKALEPLEGGMAGGVDLEHVQEAETERDSKPVTTRPGYIGINWPSRDGRLVRLSCGWYLPLGYVNVYQGSVRPLMVSQSSALGRHMINVDGPAKHKSVFAWNHLAFCVCVCVCVLSPCPT